MPQTMTERMRRAEEIASRLESRDDSAETWKDALPLRRIGEAFQEQIAAEQKVADAVHEARERGFSWGAIGMMLGVSKQTAHTRYGGDAS